MNEFSVFHRAGEIRIALWENDNEYVRHPGYCVRKDGLHPVRKWFADLLWKALHRLKAVEPFYEKVTTGRYTKQDAAKIETMISRDLIYVLRQTGFDADKLCIVIGGEMFRELVYWYEPRFGRLTLPLNNLVREDEHGWRTEIRGLKVHVVPYLKGIAVLPKVIVAKENVPRDALMEEIRRMRDRGELRPTKPDAASKDLPDWFWDEADEKGV